MGQPGSVKDGATDLHEEMPLRLSEHAHYVRLDDQIVVADMRSGHYLGLDEVGARVWELIGEQHLGCDSIVERLYSEYDVPMHVLKRDVEELLGDLLQRRLVEQEPSEARSGMRRVRG